VRTAADGTIELKVAPGTYVVELDEPIAFRGKAYTWTRLSRCAPDGRRCSTSRRTTPRALRSARLSADSATLLTAWPRQRGRDLDPTRACRRVS
jgi:hypothetical protein